MLETAPQKMKVNLTEIRFPLAFSELGEGASAEADEVVLTVCR